MYSQSFSPLNLYSCTTQTERRNSGLDKDTLVHEIELCIGNSIDNGSYQFKIKTLKEGNYILLYSNLKKSRLFGTFVFSTVIY